MKICYIVHNYKNLDEGVRNVAFNLEKELSKQHDTVRLNIKDIFKNLWSIRRYQPDIIHFIVGPSTIFSFIISKILSICFKNIKIIMSAPQPGHIYPKKLISFFTPDLILIQSVESEKLFANLGCNTEFLSNGVDTEKFSPIEIDKKYILREKYGIERDKFVVLHVGHIRPSRNISSLAKLQDEDVQVLIIGSTSTLADENLQQQLKESGCNVRIDYFENIEELYTLSDCYAFPTIDKFSCIEIPLSILEAMSCNLPVISTKFGALTRMFSEGGGLYFIDKDDEFVKIIKKIKNNDTIVKTREKILPYSWRNIGKRLDNIYNRLT